jgi:Fe-S cluster assembly protein SufD
VSATIPLTLGREPPGPPSARPTRLAALTDLTAAGWPTRRREAWRYTDLEPLADAGFDLNPAALDAGVIDAVRQMVDSAAFGDPSRRFVLLDGRHVAGLGAARMDGVELSAPESHWHASQPELAISAQHYPLAALNTAYTQQGLWLRVPAGIAAAPIHIVITGSARARVAAQPRIVIEAAPGARATVIQHFVDLDNGTAAWTNCVTQIEQAPSSHLELYRFQRHDQAQSHTSLLAANVGADSSLTIGYFDFGGRLVRNDIQVGLLGAGARTELFGLFAAGNGQHVDDHTTIRHAAGQTQSRENFRGIIGNRGRGVFNGKVIVEPGCQRIDAEQRNDNLLLGEQAEVDAKPELEIYANDVKCSHGSTVGDLDDEHLFYLRTRGLSAADARRVLTTAFAATIVGHLRDERLQEQALEYVTAHFAQLGAR